MSDKEIAWNGARPCNGRYMATDRFAGLMLEEPPVVVAARDEIALLPALLSRLLRQRSRLLVWADDAPRSWQLARRLALHIADAVLVGDEVAEAQVTQAGKPASAVFNVPGPYAIEEFLQHEAGRSGEAAHRLVVCGGLTPDGDSINVLASASAWAEGHAGRRLELCWLGHGDLRGVLAAQSLPDNLVQRFSCATNLAETQAAFLRAGVLIAGAPTRADLARRGEVLAQAMASGLVVLFDRDCPVASRLLRHGVTGFGYLGSRPGGLRDALDEALDLPAGALDQMRKAARLRVLPMDALGFDDRLSRVLENVVRNAAAGRPGKRRLVPPPVLQAR